MLHMLCHQGNANSNNEISLHTYQNDQNLMLERTRRNSQSHSLQVGKQYGTSTVEDSGWFLTKLEITCDPEITLLSIYLQELKTYIHTKTCKWMFMETLFIAVKLRRNQDICPSVCEWVNKLWYIKKWEIIQC